MTYLQVRNWHKWQSYRADRGQPPWIKLHRSLLRDPDWIGLPDRYRAHLISIWLLAADREGQVPNDAKMLQRLCQLDAKPDLKRLQADGFLTPVGCQADATVTPERRHDDRPEAEAEAEAEERERRAEETADARAPNGRPPPPPSSSKAAALDWLNGQAEDVRSEFDDYYRNDHPEQEPKWKAVAPFREKLARLDRHRKQVEADAQPHRCPYGICDGTRFIQRTVAEYVRTVRNDAGESCEATVPEHTTASPCKCHAAYGKGIS